MGTLTDKAKIPADRKAVASLRIPKVALADGTYTLVAQVTQAGGTVTASAPSPTVVVGTGGTTTGGGGNDRRWRGNDRRRRHPRPGSPGTITSATADYSPDPLAGYAQYATEIDTVISLTNGGAAITGADTVTLFASSSSTFDASATQVGQITLSPSIGGGTSTLKADFGLSAGPTYSENDYYIYVQITPASSTTPVVTAAYGKTIQFDGNIVG